MSDVGSFFIPYQNITIPNPTPFYPKITSSSGGFKVTFNQGYVIDLCQKMPSIVKVEKCSTPITLTEGGALRKFYFKVTYKTEAEIVQDPNDLRSVKTASLEEIADGVGETYTKNIKTYLVCEIEGINVKKVILRENIVAGKQLFWCLDEQGNPQEYYVDAYKAVGAGP